MPGSERRYGRSTRATVTAVLVLLGAALLIAGPAFLNPYWLRVLVNIFMYAVVAQGINIVAGYTGYPAFGNVVFFGIGGYTTAVLMVKLHAPFAVGLAAGALAGPLVVVLFGPPLMRLKGHYFAIATLGFNEAIREVVSNLSSVTGGGMGMSLPIPPGGPVENARMFYYLFLGAMLLSVWATWEFSRRGLGIACCAIRDDEAKAEGIGLRTTRCKTVAWMLSAGMTGVVGGINAYWMTYIEPPSAFDMAIAVKCFVIFLLGGAGTVLGPVIGAFVVEFLANLTWSHLLNWHLGAMGGIIMLVILLFPHGFRETALRSPVLSFLAEPFRARGSESVPRGPAHPLPRVSTIRVREEPAEQGWRSFRARLFGKKSPGG